MHRVNTNQIKTPFNQLGVRKLGMTPRPQTLLPGRKPGAPPSPPPATTPRVVATQDGNASVDLDVALTLEGPVMEITRALAPSKHKKDIARPSSYKTTIKIAIPELDAAVERNQR